MDLRKSKANAKVFTFRRRCPSLPAIVATCLIRFMRRLTLCGVAVHRRRCEIASKIVMRRRMRRLYAASACGVTLCGVTFGKSLCVVA
jgi:hypothetical protein